MLLSCQPRPEFPEAASAFFARCRTADPSIFLVTIRFYDGDSDDDGRPVASSRPVEQCAPTAGEAEAVALAHFVDLVDGTILEVETEMTYDPCRGNGGASCVS